MPPFKHGELAHSLMLDEHVTPEKPGLHEQLNEPRVLAHVDVETTQLWVLSKHSFKSAHDAPSYPVEHKHIKEPTELVQVELIGQ